MLPFHLKLLDQHKPWPLPEDSQNQSAHQKWGQALRTFASQPARGRPDVQGGRNAHAGFSGSRSSEPASCSAAVQPCGGRPGRRRQLAESWLKPDWHGVAHMLQLWCCFWMAALPAASRVDVTQAQGFCTCFDGRLLSISSFQDFLPPDATCGGSCLNVSLTAGRAYCTCNDGRFLSIPSAPPHFMPLSTMGPLLHGRLFAVSAPLVCFGGRFPSTPPFPVKFTPSSLRCSC